MNKLNNIEKLSELEIVEELIKLGLIYEKKICTNQFCSKLNQNMILYERRRDKNANNKIVSWRCKSCSAYKSCLDDSFFSLFRKTPRVILSLIKCWSAQLNHVKTQSTMLLHFNESISNTLLIKLNKILRE